jgi:hypothetical protein
MTAEVDVVNSTPNVSLGQGTSEALRAEIGPVTPRVPISEAILCGILRTEDLGIARILLTLDIHGTGPSPLSRCTHTGEIYFIFGHNAIYDSHCALFTHSLRQSTLL